MSAWPQAVWIVKEIQNQFNLNQRVLYLENRYYIFAPQSATLDDKGQKQPELPEEYQDINFSDDSIWFVGSNETKNGQIIRNVYAISLYHTENGEGHWSDFLKLSVDSDTLYLNEQEFDDEIWNNATTVQEALKALAAAIKVASGSSGGITIPTGDGVWSGNNLLGYTYVESNGPDCGPTPTISLANPTQNQKQAFELIDYVRVDEDNNTQYTFHSIVKPTVSLSFIVSAY